MQNTTADYKLEINKPSRSFECKITIGNNIYTNEDLVNLTLEYSQPQEGFAIGNTISQSLDLTLLNRGDIIYSTSQIKVEIGLKIGSKIEYILMGIFNIDDIEKTDYTTKFTAYDNMIKFETPYFSSLGDKPTLKQVVNELSSKTGVEFIGSLPDYNVSKLGGFSCREVLSYVASICGGNAFITRDGKFTIKSLSEVEKSIDGNNYFEYTREEVKYKVGQISCQVDENNILSKGSTGTDSMELGFENPWVTETILTEIYNKLNGLSYLGYSMKWQGDLSLDPYDIITVTDVKNVVRKIPIISQKLSYTGGLTSEIGAKGETKNKNSFSSSGSTTNKVNRLVTEQAVIKEALIEKANIKDLEAVSIRTQNLEAKTAKIEEAIIDVAYVSDLTAINANIQTLFANDATINNALIGKADITELNAVKGTITSLDSKIANIETLVNGNLSSENIQAGGITSDKLTIANGFITNAMIASLDVAKINAGDFSTTKFRIVSDSGNMLISDNTIQIRDKNRVRVQIGKDASNDYSMYVWDSTGKLMFDATGLKADGIKNKIIRDDMISDTANISGSKINISSLISEINKDTNTTVIKSSKVQLDTVGQTLEVAFNSLKSNVDNMEIGGTNLATETNKGVTGWGWSLQTGGKTISEVTENGIRCCKMVRDSVASTGWSYIRYDKIGRAKYLAGRKYTVSFEVKSSVPTTFYCSFLEGNSTNGMNTATAKATVSEANKWTKLTFTLTMKDTFPSSTAQVLYLNGMNSSVGVSYIFRNLKIEEGNKATAWTPAPEDIDSSIESVKQITESNSTTINVMQGQIATAINNTQIVKDGQTILLKDDYNRTVSLVNSINSTIGTHTTKIDELSGNITSVDTKVNSVQRDLEGTKSTVSSHSTSISDLSSKVSTQGASISQLQNEIALKVEQTDITKAINNMDIGVSNLLKGTSKELKSVTFGGWDYYFPNNLTSWEKNKKLTGRIFLKPTNQEASCMIHVRFTDGTYKQYKGNIISAGSEGYSKVTITVPDRDDISRIQFSIRHSASSTPSDTVYYKEAKVEKGDKATDWTPAIEDVDTSIANVQTQVTTTNNKVATIETNLSSITQRVSSTESTISTHTSQLSTVDSRISTAKTSAISTAASDATTKANNALTGAKSYTDGQITTVNQTITNKVAEIKTTTDSITQRVSSAESKITTVTTNFNNLQIGGRNLAIGTSSEYSSGYSSFSGGTNVCPSLGKVLTDGLSVGDTITIRLIYKYTNIVAASGQTAKCWLQGSGNTTSWNSGTFAGSPSKVISGSGEFEFLYSFKITSEHLKNTHWNTSIRHDYVQSGKVQWKLYKVEKGTRATDWTPAPEDIDSSIANVQTQVTTTSNKVATIETNLSSITSRVSSTESSITTINGNVTSLQSRMTTAEQKITPTAITSTISSVITGGTGSISTTQFVMDKNGLAIKNGALTIKNKSGTTVLNSDTNGNLIVTGTLKSQSGAQFVSMNSGGIDFQDWNKNEQMLRIGISYFDSNRDMNGVNFALAQYGDFIRFSHIAKADITNGWTSSDTQYNFMDFWSSDQTVGGVAYKKGINIYSPMFVNSGIQLFSGTNFPSEILGAVSWDNGNGTIWNMMGLYGDNGTILGYKNGSNLQARFIVSEAAHPGTGDNLISWGNYNFNGYTFHNANIVAKSLSVSGSKNCLQETKSYGSRLINAYETAEYYFGDLGFGKINEAGECLAYIDDTFLECVNTNAQYHVFTQVYNGSIKTIERYKTYVVIKGEPGTNFSWQLMGKRIGYENNRLDTQDIETQGENKIELFGDWDFKVETSEDTLMDVLTFELEDLLMEG